MLAYRFNPSHGEQNGFAMADTFLGPFHSTANLTKADGNDEDPFLWQQKADRSLHILYHNGVQWLRHHFWSKRQQKFMCYVYNLDLAKATRWHEKCKETEQELLDDFMEDPDELEVTTIRLADRIKKWYEVRIHWLDSLGALSN